MDPKMSFYVLSSLLASVTLLAMGIFMFINGKSRFEIRLWGYICFGVVFWQIGSYGFSTASSKEMALYWWQFAHIGTMLVPPIFFHFICAYLKINRKWLIISAYIISVVFIVVNLFCGRYFIGDLRLTPDHFYWIDWFKYRNLLFIVYYMLIYAILLGYSYFILINAYRHSKGIKRKQMQYLIIGTAVAWSGPMGIIISYFRINLYTYTNILMGIFPIIMGYAIARHRLMDIELIIKKTIVFTGLLAALLTVFILPILMIQEFMSIRLNFGGRVLTLSVSMLLIILIIDPLKSFLTRVTDKFLFQKKYDPSQVIRDFIDYAATVLDIDKIVTETIELLDKTIHPYFSAILLLDSDKYASHGTKSDAGKITFDANSAIIAYLQATKSILSLESENNKKIRKDIQDKMLELKAVLAVPLLLQNNLIGVMLLGKKKSDEFYSPEDLTTLMDLARTLAIALKNAEYVKERDAMHMEMTQAKLKEELATMAYGMSHQFNNKFQGIAMTARCAKMLLSRANIPEEIKNNLKDVVDNMTQAEEVALGAGEIARGLLNFTKPDRVQFAMVDIMHSIDVVLQLVEYKHPGFKDVEVIKNIAANLPLTYAHMGYLQEAYFIVLDNAYEAIEYMKARGIPGYKSQIIITASKEITGKYIAVAIKDNGVGMTPKVLENVRNVIPFYSTKGSSGKSGGGIGNKMLNKFVVEHHNGKVTYDSVENEGTTVSIYIPIIEKPRED